MSAQLRTRVRRCGAGLLVLGAAVGLSVLPSSAMYSDQDAVAGNAFTTGTIDLSEISGTKFTATGMTPGDVVTAPLTLQNTGSAGLRYAMRSTTTENTLASALTLTLRTRAVSDPGCTAFDGTLIYSGVFGSTTGTNIIGDPSTGAQPFDRWLGSGEKDMWCARVALPLGATNTIAAHTTTADFVFTAEQVANNGAVYASPVLTGQAWASIPGTGAAATITVPAGVKETDLGVLATGTDNLTLRTTTAAGWTTRAANPAGQNNSSWSLLTRMGGLKAGDTFTVTLTGTNNVDIGVAWYNTGGRDVVLAGTAGTRNGERLSSTTIPGVTTTVAGSDFLIVASERTFGAKSITGWMPADVTQDAFQNGSTSDVSHVFGHFKQAGLGATGSRMVTYSYGTPSGNATGMMLALGPTGRVSA